MPYHTETCNRAARRLLLGGLAVLALLVVAWRILGAVVEGFKGAAG